MKTGSPQSSPPLCCSVCCLSRRKRGCCCATLTGRGTVFPGHHPQVTEEQLLKLHAATEREPADGGEEDEERESDRSRGRTRANRRAGVVSKSVPLLMCVVSLPPGLHKFCILPTGSVIHQTCPLINHFHITSHSCSFLCLSDFDSVAPTLKFSVSS